MEVFMGSVKHILFQDVTQGGGVRADHLRFNSGPYTRAMRTLTAGTLLALLTCSVLAATDHDPVVPDPRLSPGDVLTSDTKIICVPGYTKTVRNVPQALKEQVYREYTITGRAPGEYEIDHIISLELGGSNSIRNLFPESFKSQPLNAHVKDTLENKLHDLACSGKITMQEAQQAIASNWTTAYVKYVGPLPGGAQPVQEVAGSTGQKTAAPASGSAAPIPVLPATTASSGSAPPNVDGSCPAAAPIKVSKAGIYHLPQGDGSYARTHAQSCFATPGVAQAAGYRAPR